MIVAQNDSLDLAINTLYLTFKIYAANRSIAE